MSRIQSTMISSKLIALILISIVVFPVDARSINPVRNDQALIVADHPGGDTALGYLESNKEGGYRDSARDQVPYGKLPLYFVENRGQIDSHIRFYALGGSILVYFSDEDITFIFNRQETSGDPTVSPVAAMHNREIWVVKLEFMNANQTQPTGLNQTEAMVSYFTGAPEQWKTGMRTYERLIYRDLWPGIDLSLYGQNGQLKYDFNVRPGANPRAIQLRYRGAEQVIIDDEGRIEVRTVLGSLIDEAPHAWQLIGGEQHEVRSHYRLINNPDPRLRGRTAGTTYGFNLGAYDKRYELIIDPAVVVFGGYIGGLGYESGEDIAVDLEGNTYITGQTNPPHENFPVLVGPDLSDNGEVDAFVAKVDKSGTELIYAGYIGGDNNEIGYGIAVDLNNNAYVAGKTMSTQPSFPVEAGPDLTHNGVEDAFIAKVNAEGTALIYSGFIGGNVWDKALDVAVDDEGNAYVVGNAGSNQDSFPVTGGPDLYFNGTEDAFIAKVEPDGTDLIFAGYIGGSGWDWGYGVAVDEDGNAYVVGQTDSSEVSFPESVGPDLSYNGNWDGFVAKVDETGTSLLYAGYIGGSVEDRGWDIAVDDNGNAYIVGETASSQETFPVLIGPDLTYNGGEKDAFIAKVGPDGSNLVYCGYIGGTGGDFAYGVAIDLEGEAYIAGFTYSDQVTFPVINGPDATYGGGERDAFTSKVEETGADLEYSGYVGGKEPEYGLAIAVDGEGNAYMTGNTYSTQDSFPVRIGPDLTHNGGYDAFIVKLSLVPWFTYLPLTTK